MGPSSFWNTQKATFWNRVISPIWPSALIYVYINIPWRSTIFSRCWFFFGWCDENLKPTYKKLVAKDFQGIDIYIYIYCIYIYILYVSPSDHQHHQPFRNVGHQWAQHLRIPWRTPRFWSLGKHVIQPTTVLYRSARWALDPVINEDLYK